MAEEFHIIDFPEDNHIDAKEFSKIAKNAAELTEDYSFHAGLDALNTLLSITEGEPAIIPAQSTPLEQAGAIASDTLAQASLMIDEVRRFKTLSAEIAKHS
ncbi:hypothetical protein [Kiloniella antarctica]|uniref:EF-hand domain-containing protein n=1 Tax=Kiloniella antarctica TaxID=1550907 RepID=A0ABW5BG20_9PROT